MSEIETLFDHQAFTMQKYGGVSRYFIELKKNLINHGVDVNISCFIHRNKFLSNEDEFNNKGLYLNCSDEKVKYLNIINEKLIYMRRQKKPLIYHPTYYKLSKKYSASLPTVITVYDFIHEFFDGDKKTIARKESAIQRADHIICISNQTKTDLINLYGIDEASVTVTHLACADMWAGQCDSSISIDKPYVVYVGQRSGYKNFELLISTFASSNFLKENFKIIAFGGGKFDGIECQKFHELGLSEGTIQHVTGNDYILRELYQRARAFIYPSLYEGFGLPVLEALTSGCPTFCSNSGSIPEVGGDAVVYFDPTKLEDLKTKLEHYLQSDTALKAFKALGKVQAAKFSWDLTAKKTSEAYSNVL